MKLIKALLLVAFLSPLTALADTLTGQVVDVHDGDTLSVTVKGMKYKVRLLGVDTPEVDFFGNSQGEVAFIARDFVKSLAPVGSQITVIYDANGFDKHNRVLGRVIANNVEVNLEVLKAGLGYMYFIFPFDKGLAADYSAAAKSAVDNQLGLFSAAYSNVLAPYDFRMSSKNQTGTNLVGDLQTKMLYFQEDSDKVPVWRRVFFSDKEFAVRNGYRFF